MPKIKSITLDVQSIAGQFMHWRTFLPLTITLATGFMFHRFVFSRTTDVEPPATKLKADEQLVFYPTYGLVDPETNQWRLSVHGKVFEPERRSIKRRFLLAFIKSAVDDSISGDELREDRLRHFLVDNERGKSVTIKFGDRRWYAGKSTSNGHFYQTMTIADELIQTTETSNGVIHFQAVLKEQDQREFFGRVHLLSANGISVISDLDDTIKVSRVTDRKELLRNTLMRDFRAVPGMAAVYRELAESDVAFHYVSGSPWQLFRPLESFLSDSGFPDGTMQLKHFRLKDTSALELLGSQMKNKLAAIEPLLKDFPNRRFVLIGDSGEQDPEIYGHLSRNYPNQILGCFIRNVTSASRDEARFVDAFAGVKMDRWQLFDEAEQLGERLRLLLDGSNELQQ